MNNTYRHGDILIKAVEKPSGLTLIGKMDKFVVAEGETTGHKHLLTAEPGTAFEILKDEKGNLYLDLKGRAKLTHEEHKEIELLPDFYIVGNEREFDYFSQEVMRVRD